MKYAFFGTSEFAAIILERLLRAGMAPALVVTNLDKPAGRHGALTPPPVKKKVSDLQSTICGMPLIQPGRLSPAAFKEHPQFDFFVVAAYGKIIPKSALSLPRLGAVNVHPSLLPKYRGPSPIQTAILNGDEATGVTLILLDEEVDHGPIIATSNLKSQISNLTYTELHGKLAELGAEMLIETLPKFARGEIAPVPQDHAGATFTHKFEAGDARVEYADFVRAVRGEDPETAARILRMIRAFTPEPGAWMMAGEPQLFDLPKAKRVKLLEARVEHGTLVPVRVQVEGKKPRTL